MHVVQAPVPICLKRKKLKNKRKSKKNDILNKNHDMQKSKKLTFPFQICNILLFYILCRIVEYDTKYI